MTKEEAQKLQQLRGLVACVVTSGHVDDAFAEHFSHIRSFCDRNGFHNVEWRRFPAVLVESGRDRVAQHAVNEDYDFVIQVDADCAPMPPDLVVKLLETAYVTAEDSDVIGAYCQLKNPPYLPTIDTGTGTWEVIYPNSGILPAIRTGGHCHLVKVGAYRRFGPPWYKTRVTMSPAQAFAEVDNMARCWTHGENPLRGEAWDELVMQAQQKAPKGPDGTVHVGEDSGFCDALKAAGGVIYVNTDIVVGHIMKKVLTVEDMKKELDTQETGRRLLCGVLA